MPSFYESSSEARWWVGIYGRLLLIVVLLGLIGLGVFTFKTVVADEKGKADQFRQQRSGANRVFAQQQFHDLYQDYQATVTKIPRYKAQAATGDPAANTNLTGLLSHCADVVGQYNAASSKYLARDFKDVDLPIALDGGACT